MAQIVLDRISKQYVRNGPFAVRDFSLRVADGEFVVLVGPSGCGKTTILRLIAGLEQLTSGDIRLGGRSAKDVAPRERNVAMVFQDYALYPHMTVRQNIAFGLKTRGFVRADIEQRVTSTAAMLRFADLLDRKPGSLSGGQRQRVALGRALARFPGAACMLLDEPLSNLDSRLRTELRKEIKVMHQAMRMTAILVTHDEDDAAALGDRVIDMQAVASRT
jgi:ABC-type sugar transport system ATPase subunit